MVVCANCGSPALTYELGEDPKLHGPCLVCGAKLLPEEPNQQTTTNPFAAEQPERAQPTKQTVAASKRPIGEKFDVLKAARARLRELNSEIARLKKLTEERDQLKRLLEAAKKTTGAKGAVPLRRCAS